MSQTYRLDPSGCLSDEMIAGEDSTSDQSSLTRHTTKKSQYLLRPPPDLPHPLGHIACQHGRRGSTSISHYFPVTGTGKALAKVKAPAPHLSYPLPPIKSCNLQLLKIISTVSNQNKG